MHLQPLIAALSDPRAYPVPVDAVVVRQTHISVVFLAGEHAYKVKKPVDLGFLDFSTLAKRRYFCDEEVRLNRRLAPSVYLGVVPVTRTGNTVQVEGTGEVVEWAVKMRRLPDDATLLKRVLRGELDVPQVQALARAVAKFHKHAAGGERATEFGRFEVVAGNARENLAQAAGHVGRTVSPAVFGRLLDLTDDLLKCLRPVMEARAARGVTRDTHGDLHLDHVYQFPSRPPPDNLVVVDCIEFNERFRFADPVADAAFLVMDLAFHRRHDLAAAFADAYFRAAGDDEGRALLPFYTAYRAAVRGKVEAIRAVEPEVSAEERSASMASARAHWLLALGELERPARRPCLVLVSGLPGTGKSTLARGLAERAGFTVIRSDAVRKELAGLGSDTAAESPFGTGIYAAEWTRRTYAECLRRAEALVFEGERVAVDASFGDDEWRRTFLEAGARWSVPALLLVCEARPEVVRARLSSRTGDVSDADWSVYVRAAERWESPGPATLAAVAVIPSAGPLEPILAIALGVLRLRGLFN